MHSNSTRGENMNKLDQSSSFSRLWHLGESTSSMNINPPRQFPYDSVVGRQEENIYSLFDASRCNNDIDKKSSKEKMSSTSEKLSPRELDQIQENIKKLFGINNNSQTETTHSNERTATSGPLSFSAMNGGGGGCGKSTCRTLTCATAQHESRINAFSDSAGQKPGRSSGSPILNNSWPIVDTDFTYSLGPNVKQQLENSVIYPKSSSSINQQLTKKVSRLSLIPNSSSGIIPATSSLSNPLVQQKHQSLNRDKMRSVIPNFCRTNWSNDPPVFYRFYQFECPCNKKIWFSPLAKAKDGLFCWDCTHFVKPFAHFDGSTPYQGSELCYGKFECHICKNTWSSRRSMANAAENCFGCGASIYPYYQVTLTTVEKKKRRMEAVTAFKTDLGFRSHSGRTLNPARNLTTYCGRSRDSSCGNNGGCQLHNYYENYHHYHGKHFHTNASTVGESESHDIPPRPRHRLKKSTLVFSISSPALIQKRNNNVTSS